MSCNFETFASTLKSIQNHKMVHTLSYIPAAPSGSESEDPEFLEALREGGVWVELLVRPGHTFSFEMMLGVDIGYEPWNTQDYFRVTKEEDRLKAACASIMDWYQHTRDTAPKKDSYFYKELPTLAELARSAYPSVEAFVKGPVTA